MDFEKARFNMIEQQIRPWDVLDTGILDLMFDVKREDFVSDDLRNLAFTDRELPLPNGKLMLQPKVEARLLQDLEVAAGDKVLEVGTGSGYVTALIAKLAREVLSVEIDGAQLERAAAALRKSGVGNARLFEGNGVEGLAGQAPFDAIYVGGSLPVVPEALKQQLAVGGRMVVVVGDLPVMRALRIRRVSETDFSSEEMFDICVQRLEGAEAIEPERFSF
ncbi:protein-L-isoaspartate O-methyltransferase family protein [Crenobacter intestini]|uniref:Protein-L-isoaspartate O-methyltransferase n=1 Tax=Crenobacter intestini TaxID=2563443 RepID=A0A4T0UPU5_9NEIS|nr:protein-L-isoaspartate O-methyltransferase [Crenobacter intestini]TIC80576.1 protein-L-isoaspartate O-methyltransferase [Crenobacter intestini]